MALVVTGLALAAAAGLALFSPAGVREWALWSVMLVALLAVIPAFLTLRRSRHTPPSPRSTDTDDTGRSLFERLAAGLHDGVVIIDRQRIHCANAAAARLLGIAGGQVPTEGLLAAVFGPTAQPTVLAELVDPQGRAFKAELNMQMLDHDRRLVVIRDLSEVESGRAALANSNAELQAMAGRLFSVQEDERRSISRDLHDDIGQAITAMKLAACAARDEDDTARRQEDIDQIIELADSTVTKLRNLSMLLRPPQLDALGLEAALRWQAGMLFRSSPVELLLHVDTLSHRPSNEVEQACFRIAQESLTNALRHARASQVSLLLRDDGDGGLHLQVIDDGEGFDLSAPRGLGMIVMRERAQSAGGSLHIETAPGEGTCINLRLPCAPLAC